MGLARRLFRETDLLTLNPRKIGRSLGALRGYADEKKAFYAQYEADPEKPFPPGPLYPCLKDRYEEGGTAGGQYFHQDLLVAQMVFRNNPERHVDVGSRIDGFVAHVAAFREIEVFDIREVSSSAANIKFCKKDLMGEDPELSECTDSLSCLHALEHFGLGRYGDPVDYRGYEKGFDSLVRMTKRGGRIYFSVPISKDQRFEFNAHRVFRIGYLLQLFAGHRLAVENFAYVDDRGELHVDVDWTSPAAGGTFGLKYGCGIFALRKPS